MVFSGRANSGSCIKGSAHCAKWPKCQARLGSVYFENQQEKHFDNKN